MSTSADPLLALRDAIKSQTTITYSDGSNTTPSLNSATHIVLSSTVSLPKSAPTRLRKPGASSTDPSASPQDFFSLEAVYLTWLLRQSSGAEYMKQAREHGLTVGFVSVTERKNVVDRLEGKTNDLHGLISLASQYPGDSLCVVDIDIPNNS